MLNTEGSRLGTAQSPLRGLRSVLAVPCAAAVLLLCLCLRPGSSAAADERPAALDYVIVVTGTELLTGIYPDGHTQFLTQTLHPLGLRCVGSMTVDDKPADIAAALGDAARRAGLVIVTGGLGPTDNDVTRETLSQFTGIALAEQPEVIADMERRFKTPRDELRPNLRAQARVPVRGGYLKNAGGTSVGLIFDSGDRAVVALPGPPRELQPMVRQELVPWLSRRFGTRLPGCSITLRFVGLGQSQIDHTIEQHMTLPPDVGVTSQFEAGRVDFTFSLPHDTPENRRRLEELKTEIIKHFGASIYATDDTSLEEQIARRLAARSESLALAEVGSGGGLEAALSTAATGRQILAGGMSAPSEDKLAVLLRLDAEPFRAADETSRVQRLASAAAEAAGSSWAVATGEIRAGAEGPSLIVAFRAPDGRVETETLSAVGAGATARASLVTQLLDRLRRKLP